jgi:hypothetical protein
MVDKALSEFISRLPPTLFSPNPPALTAKDRIEIAKLLGRQTMNEEVVQSKIQEQYVICIPDGLGVDLGLSIAAQQIG